MTSLHSFLCHRLQKIRENKSGADANDLISNILIQADNVPKGKLSDEENRIRSIVIGFSKFPRGKQLKWARKAQETLDIANFHVEFSEFKSILNQKVSYD